MSKTRHQVISLLQQAFDALEATTDSDIDTFEDEEEEAEAVPAQYAARKIMEAMDMLRADNRAMLLGDATANAEVTRPGGFSPGPVSEANEG